MRRFLAIAIFGLWALADLWLLSVVAGWITWLGVIAVLILQFFIGAAIVRRAGAAAFRALNDSLTGTPEAGSQAGSQGLLALAGSLIAFPGFTSDLIGAVLLLPPVRKGVALLTSRLMARRIARMTGPLSPAGFRRGDETIVVTSVVRDETTDVMVERPVITDTPQ